MRYALNLAKQGRGRVNPNPLVGAVLVKEGRIIGEGYHEVYGAAHAEINAIKSALEKTEGATLYVTLEPCNHYGKTPPCTEAIIQNKITQVVVGMLDPNPLVAGSGIKRLEEAGVEVIVGILEEECQRLNEVFIKYITKQEPFVLLKAAMTLDGKIATATGESKWITGEASRTAVHELRNSYLGIMVGIETIIKDDPQLTCRLIDGRNPIIIVVDSTLRIPLDSQIINSGSKVIIATVKGTENIAEDKVRKLEALGVQVLFIEEHKCRVNLKQLIIQLGRLGIDSILLEGGAEVNASALEAGIVDKVQFYIAPKIIGGRQGKTPVAGVGIAQLEEAIKIEGLQIQQVGEDILLEGYIREK